jgi:hypothetical protein
MATISLWCSLQARLRVVGSAACKTMSSQAVVTGSSPHLMTLGWKAGSVPLRTMRLHVLHATPHPCHLLMHAVTGSSIGWDGAPHGVGGLLADHRRLRRALLHAACLSTWLSAMCSQALCCTPYLDSLPHGREAGLVDGSLPLQVKDLLLKCRVRDDHPLAPDRGCSVNFPAHPQSTAKYQSRWADLLPEEPQPIHGAKLLGPFVLVQVLLRYRTKRRALTWLPLHTVAGATKQFAKRGRLLMHL